MKYCPECGVELKGASKFCPECGAKLSVEERLSSAEIIEKQINNTAKREKGKVKPTAIIAIVAVLLIAITVGLFAGGVFKKEEPVIPASPFSDDTVAIQAASDSVIRLNCYDKDGNLYCTGSAFAAFEDGVFVTNYHVIEQEVYSILAYTEDNTMFEITSVLAYDADKDMAIIKTDANTGIMSLPLGVSDALEKGEKVVAIGSPLGLLNTVSTGVFSGYNNNGVMDELQFTASISSGSSGGALFNDKGEVIGITYASYINGQNLNVAVPINEVLQLWETKGKGISILEFYETFEHIPVYSVSYFDDNWRDLTNQELCIEGIIARTTDPYENPCLYLVETEQDIQRLDLWLNDTKYLPEMKYTAPAYAVVNSIGENAHNYKTGDLIKVYAYVYETTCTTGIGARMGWTYSDFDIISIELISG